MSIVNVSLDNTFILLALLISLIVLTFRMANKNEGKWKSFYILTGLFIAIFGVVLYDLLASTTSTWSLTLIIIFRASTIIFTIMGVVLMIASFKYLFVTNKT